MFDTLPSWKITLVSLCGFWIIIIPLGIKLHKDSDSKIFQAWVKQTGNPKNLTFEEWRLVRRELRYKEYE